MASRFSTTTEILLPDTFARKSFVWAFFITIGLTILVGIALGFMPNVVPLFYSLPWGESRLTQKYFLFLLPAISGVFILVNLIIARVIRREHILMVKALALSTLLVSGMLFYTFLGIAISIL